MVDNYPEDFDTWSERAQWIIAGLCDVSKRSREQLTDFLTICNSDTTKHNIIHWCNGCCQNEQDTVDKALRAGVPFFSHGFPVPLLYRFKHYAVASSYIKTASCCFDLLARVLLQMQTNTENQADASAKLGGLVDSLLQEGDGSNPLEDPMNFQGRLDELLDSDLSFSMQNSVRKRLVIQEITKPGFKQSALLIDAIVSSLEYGTNAFLQRTTWLTRISTLGSNHPEHQELSAKSKDSFLRIVSGRMGMDLIHRTIALLEDGLIEFVRMGFDATPDQLILFFTLVIACASDVWRRMVLEFSTAYPFKVFEWLSAECTLERFVESWDQMLAVKARCQGCSDATFASVIAEEHPQPLAGALRDVQVNLHQEIKQLLSHIASYTPTNSDTVEVKHGNMQWAVSKRGAMYVKKQRAAKETSLLQSVIRTHGLAYDDTYKSTMPRPVTRAGVRKRVGKYGVNQHSSKDGVCIDAIYFSRFG